MLDALHAIVCEVEQDHSLEQPERLRERVRAMERLEDLLQTPCGAAPAQQTGIDELHRRAQARHAALAEVQRRLCDGVRHAIQHGAGAHALRGWVRRDDLRAAPGYDHLDALVGEVLALREPAGETSPPEAEMVFYQPTPARHVLDLIERAQLGCNDLLVDLGSGLGHVPLLVTICTGARALGIEREAAYVDSARRAAASLHVERASFLVQDAREADLSQGTLFYLYTPFTGGMLRCMLDRLAVEARRRAIRVAALGPCMPAIAAEPWLRALGASDAERISLFQSVAANA